MFIGLYIRKKKIVECYQYHVQYPEAAANLIVVLDQHGEVWQSHKFLGGWGSVTISPFILVLLLAIVLEIFWLVLLGIKNILFRFIKK